MMNNYPSHEAYCPRCRGGNPPDAGWCMWCGATMRVFAPQQYPPPAGPNPYPGSGPAGAAGPIPAPPFYPLPPNAGQALPRGKSSAARTAGGCISAALVLFVGVPICLLLVLTFLGSNSRGGTTASTARDRYMLPAGTQAPDFTLPATDGKTYSLSQFKGKPVLLEFMAPWCPYCQRDSPILNQVYDVYASKGVEVLGVNATIYGRNYEDNDKSLITMDDQKWYADTFGVKYPLLFDEPATAGDGSLDTPERTVYGIQAYPSLYILDKNGKVASHILPTVGDGLTYDHIAAELDKVLK